jgi:hypothetical protein
MKRVIAAAAFASFLAAPAMSDDLPQWIGFGAEHGGCGRWAMEASGTWIDHVYSAWVMGYVSGANTWGHGIANSTSGFPNESVVLWVKNYCRGRPLEQVGVGAMGVIYELAKPAQH